MQFGDKKAAIDCCMQLHQWDQALQLAQQCNFTEAEDLLQQYAQHLLEKKKYLEAVELYRKVSTCVYSARDSRSGLPSRPCRAWQCQSPGSVVMLAAGSHHQ